MRAKPFNRQRSTDHASRPILLIDNYDSFVFNLARYLEELGCPTRVVRNDAVSVGEVRAMRPPAIVISPGPCTPGEAGISVELVRRLSPCTPILGVCLGHQAIATALGGGVVCANEPVHGRTSLIRHAGGGLFRGLPNPLQAARYHSLIVEESSLPADLLVTARTVTGTGQDSRDDGGVVMAVEHVALPVYGVQFHPESILTQSGHRLLANFLLAAGRDCLDGPTGELEEPAEQAPPQIQSQLLRTAWW